jgi:hypothetical protein
MLLSCDDVSSSMIVFYAAGGADIGPGCKARTARSQECPPGQNQSLTIALRQNRQSVGLSCAPTSSVQVRHPIHSEERHGRVVRTHLLNFEYRKVRRKITVGSSRRLSLLPRTPPNDSLFRSFTSTTSTTPLHHPSPSASST